MLEGMSALLQENQGTSEGVFGSGTCGEGFIVSFVHYLSGFEWYFRLTKFA